MEEEKKTEIGQQLQLNFDFHLGKLEVPLCIYFILKGVEIIFNLISN